MTGQLSDTWEYGPDNPATLMPFGAGCSGTFGMPLLDSSESSLPWIGTTFSARLAPIGASANLLILGDSRTVWSGYQLPMSLAILGMPGCLLHTSILVTFPLAGSGGSAIWQVAIPNDLFLVGASLFIQGVSSDPGANQLGAVMSNACTMQIGSK